MRILYSDRFLGHDRPSHPESAARLRAVASYLKAEGVWEDLSLEASREAEVEALLRVHSRRHVEKVREACRRGVPLDADTYTCPESFSAALLAAGALIEGVEGALEGEDLFALVRPPGHHAERDRSMGFCLFNNVAVAAAYALEEKGRKRIFLLDYDAHHGNGTQEIFYSDPRVLYLSLHQHPLYPGTGRPEEVGEGDGEGYTVNLPLPPGEGDESALQGVQEVVLPLLEAFDPDLVIVSAGYDGHYLDPLAGLALTSRFYLQVSHLLRERGGGILFALEGGYHLEALPRSVLATLSPFLGREWREAEAAPEEGRGVREYAADRIRAVKGVLSEYWSL
jgi:acetoin utilization deacetylase AcuC-like enzyme